MIERLIRWFSLYVTVGFVVLILVVIYHAVVIHDLPKKVLLFSVPGYAVVAGGAYTWFKILLPVGCGRNGFDTAPETVRGGRRTDNGLNPSA